MQSNQIYPRASTKSQTLPMSGHKHKKSHQPIHRIDKIYETLSSIKFCHGRAKPRAVHSRGGWPSFHSQLKSNLTKVTDVIPRQAVAA